MLIAFGKVNLNSLIDGMIRMAGDENSIHEHNEKKKVRKWKHPHGWGAAYLKEGKWEIKRSVKPIFEDKEINLLRNVRSEVVLLHARKGTKGDVILENVHPFQNQSLVFCHNGTVWGKIHFSGRYKPAGTTDSEKLFYSLCDEFGNDLALNPVIIRKKLNKLDIISGSNIILSSPARTIIGVHFRKYPKYYGMAWGKGDGFSIVSSEKIPGLRCRWQFLSNNDLLVVEHDTFQVEVIKET